MVTAIQDVLYFQNSDDPDDAFQLSLIDAPEKFIEKTVVHFTNKNFALVDRVRNNIKLPRRYNAYLWFIVGGGVGGFTTGLLYQTLGMF